MPFNQKDKPSHIPPGKSIRAWRKYRNLTQKQVEDRIGKSYGTLSKLESGGIEYTQEHLELLAEAFGCEGGAAHVLLGPPEADRPESEFERYKRTLNKAQLGQAVEVMRAMFKAS